MITYDLCFQRMPFFVLPCHDLYSDFALPEFGYVVALAATSPQGANIMYLKNTS